jgi:hypothetical protein
LDDLDAKLHRIATGLAQIAETQAAQVDLMAAGLKALQLQPTPAALGHADASGALDKTAPVAQTAAAAGAAKTSKKGLR